MSPPKHRSPMPEQANLVSHLIVPSRAICCGILPWPGVIYFVLSYNVLLTPQTQIANTSAQRTWFTGLQLVWIFGVLKQDAAMP